MELKSIKEEVQYLVSSSNTRKYRRKRRSLTLIKEEVEHVIKIIIVNNDKVRKKSSFKMKNFKK